MTFSVSDEFLNIEGMYYILDAHNEVIPGHFFDWIQWRIQNPERISVAHTEIDPDIRVSTMFLGINLNFIGPPMVFETMAFKRLPDGDEDAIYQMRYQTYTQAEVGHEITVNELRQQNAD